MTTTILHVQRSHGIQPLEHLMAAWQAVLLAKAPSAQGEVLSGQDTLMVVRCMEVLLANKIQIARNISRQANPLLVTAVVDGGVW